MSEKGLAGLTFGKKETGKASTPEITRCPECGISRHPLKRTAAMITHWIPARSDDVYVFTAADLSENIIEDIINDQPVSGLGSSAFLW
jgi:hypothetical protein